MRKATSYLCLVIVISILCGANISEAQSVEIIEIDSYQKKVLRGSSVTYNWTIRNVDLVGINYTIYINVTNPDEKWTVTISPNIIKDLGPNKAKMATLTVKAPSHIEYGTLNVTVNFVCFQDNAIISSIHKNAVTTIIRPTEKKVLGYFENPLPPPLEGVLGVFLLNIVIWLIISVAVVFILDPVIRKLTEKTKTKLDDIILAVLRKPVMLIIFLYGIFSSLSILEDYIPENVLKHTMQIYMLILVLTLFYVGYRLFKDILIHYAKELSKKTATKIDDILVPIVEKVGIIIIALAALGYLLGYLNVDITLFVAGGVVISMVIAFALQDSLSNIFAGLFLLGDRPFAEGDIVILSDGDWCEVRKIGLRSTRLFRFSDASIVYMPNNKLVNEKIANFTGPADKGRVYATFGVAYGSDPEKVKNIIREVINNCEHIIRDDPNLTPIVRFDELADSSLKFFVLVWITDRKYRFDVKDYLNTNIYKRFNEEGIEIPFPQRTVHIRMEGDKNVKST